MRSAFEYEVDRLEAELFNTKKLVLEHEDKELTYLIEIKTTVSIYLLAIPSPLKSTVCLKNSNKMVPTLMA